MILFRPFSTDVENLDFQCADDGDIPMDDDCDIGHDLDSFVFDDSRCESIAQIDALSSDEDDDLGSSLLSDDTGDFEDCESVQLPDARVYSIDTIDPLCIKFDQLLTEGKISRNGILYKHLNDVVEIFFDPFHAYDEDVIEFFNSLSHVGGRASVNLVIGPMRTGEGRYSHSTEPRMNFGGPSRPTRRKKESGYTTKSGVIKELSLCQLKLCSNGKSEGSFLVSNPTVQVIPCVLSNDGNALKPAIEFDNHFCRNIGLDFDIDYDYVKNNPCPTPDFLSSHIVTEVVISSVTSLENESSMPCIAEYVPKAGKTGENLFKSFTENILLLQMCERCQSVCKSDEHVLQAKATRCNSTCDECLQRQSVCEQCVVLGHEHYQPSLRACNDCLENGIRCIRRVVLVLCADCESGNKKAFEMIIEEITQGTIHPNLCLLAIMPDAVHIGKNLKGGFSNWMLVIGQERGCLGFLRVLRSRASNSVVKMMHSLIPKGDHVAYRDRQDPAGVIAITRPEVANYLASLGYVSCTIIPEMTKFTNDNKPNAYPKPVDVCIADFGHILVLFDYDNVNCTSSLLRARLHCPVDKISVLRKNVRANEVHYMGGVAYLCGSRSSISFVEIVAESVVIKGGKDRRKCDFISMLRRFNLNVEGPVKVLKERLVNHLRDTNERYAVNGFSKNVINFGGGQYSFDSIATTETANMLFAAVSSQRYIGRILVSSDGVGLTGEITEFVPYEPVWGNIRSLCVTSSMVYITHSNGLSIIDRDTLLVTKNICNTDQFEANRVAPYKEGALVTDSKYRKVWRYLQGETNVQTFAGTGAKVHKEGVAAESSFCKPCGIAVEFDNVVYLTDIDVNRVNVITTMRDSAEFLRNVGKVYKAFGVHQKGADYVIPSLPDASRLLAECIRYLRNNEHNIRSLCPVNLPSELKGPHGNVAGRTIASLEILYKGLIRLHETVTNFSYENTNQLSCLSIDVEQFHAAQHSKSVVLSMQQYCQQFGTTLKECIKRISAWGAYYFTRESSYYPLPDTAIPLRELPVMSRIPVPRLTTIQEEEMRNWARMYGRAVRQRTGRQQTTMAKAGTLPSYLYEVASSTPVNDVRHIKFDIYI